MIPTFGQSIDIYFIFFHCCLSCSIGYNVFGFAFGRVGGRSPVNTRRTLVRQQNSKLHVTPPDAKPVLVPVNFISRTVIRLFLLNHIVNHSVCKFFPLIFVFVTNVIEMFCDTRCSLVVSRSQERLLPKLASILSLFFCSRSNNSLFSLPSSLSLSM